MSEWQRFDINDPATHPPQPGRYWVVDHWTGDSDHNEIIVSDEIWPTKGAYWKHVSHWMPFVPPEPPKEV